MSINDCVKEIVVRKAPGQKLIAACAKVRGLLTDEEVDALFSRTRVSPTAS
jgi:hypothetical protein